MTETVFDDPEEETSLPGKEDPDTWTIHFDGSYTKGPTPRGKEVPGSSSLHQPVNA